jgi:tetratricopeptide (TPR) repeat protein
LPSEPAPEAKRPKKSALTRDRVMRMVEQLLQERRGRLLEEVRRIIDEELERAEAARRKQDEARRKRDQALRAQIDKARRRAEAIGKRLQAARESVERAIAQAERALGEAPHAGPKDDPGDAAPDEPPAPSVPEPYRKLIQAMRLYETGEYEKAVEEMQEAVKGLEGMDTAEARRYRAEALYHIACAHAMLGHVDQAFRELDQAVRAGYRNVDKIENDAELDSLREDPRFEKIHRYARSLKG